MPGYHYAGYGKGKESDPTNASADTLPTHHPHTTKASANKLPKLPHKKRNFKSTPILKQYLRVGGKIYLIGKKSKSQPFWKRNTSTWVFSIFFKVRIPRELISRHTTDMLVRSADTLSTLPRNKRNSKSPPILKHYPRVGGKIYLIGKEIWITAILKTKYKYLGLLDFFSKYGYQGNLLECRPTHWSHRLDYFLFISNIWKGQNLYWSLTFEFVVAPKGVV